MAQAESEVANRPRVLVVRGSFGALGGAERELLQLLRSVDQRWEASLATLEFPDHAKELLAGANIQLMHPKQDPTWPSGARAEITAAASKMAGAMGSKFKGFGKSKPKPAVEPPAQPVS